MLQFSISFYLAYYEVDNRFLSSCRYMFFIRYLCLGTKLIFQKSVMVLSGSRGFCYTLELKNEQEAKQMKKKKIRTHFHAILLTGGC